MKFYSGFSLQNEQGYFEPFVDKSDFCVAGFSYGAIKAFASVEDALAKGLRVDRLQLFSPPFFQTKSEKFKRLQLMGYTRNTQEYLDAFLHLCFLPYSVQSVQQVTPSKEELEELLYYEWDKKALQKLQNQGVAIEVYLGGEDKIIDPNKAKEFFIDVATVTFIKEANHFLQIEKN
jgi:hypothetical protein